MSLLRTQSNFRLLSTSSQDPPSSASVEHSVVNESFEFDDLVEDRNFELESLRTADFDESPSKPGHMPYINMDYIIDTIRRDEKNMESRLNLIGTSLRKFNVIEIFQVLNRDRLPALRFFYWIRNAHPKLYGNHDVCSLMFDNCWRLREYKTMLHLLEDFQSRRICLTDKAFGFLALLSSQKVIMAETVKKLLKILDEVGGPCHSSGIHSLIKMLCALNLFDMAKLIIETTETKVSYYNILVREKCIRGQLKDIRCILDEMREKGCEPAAITYNYLISSLCKHQGSTIEAYQVLDEMVERGCSPNALTFEVLIYCSCGLGNLDNAIGFYDQMVSRGIEPRLSTHAAFIKGYFYSQQYEAAYNYVVGSSMKHKPSTNWIYSLLASLHQKKGDLIVAHKILVEMIEKGLKPQHSVYSRILKRLRKTGREHLATNLEARFRSLVYQSSSMETG
ncbi:hypothetical protein Nepgr_015956 [Nepenthes gracilis]|uniref:Pentatricopeptide repeat-containing protein n=1 Tax=Nepenthes gracilis TaxID=150966 RepID=A0AAD3XS35_NEPGR|nr:hypothetical protein Nepgr_015956 [Nepenthes gracilis]